MQNIRVLIVEDERIIAMDLKLQLQALGYTVCAVVPSGQQAIDTAASTMPDLVLMDIHLEGAMDGVEAARTIHQQLKIPIIFLSAYAEDATLQRAEEALPYGYLVKPVSPRELHATLQMAMVRFNIQRQADEQVERFCKAMQAAQLEVWEWRVEIDQLQVYPLNDGHAASLVSPLSEPIRRFLALVDERDVDDVARAIEQTRVEGGSFNVVFRVRGQDTQQRWMEAHGKRFENGGSCDRIIGVMQDITERRLTEERLRQAVTVFESTAEGIAILDAARRVVSVNPAFTQLTGYTAEEAESWPTVDVLYQQPHSPQFIEQLQKQGREQWQGNVCYRHKNQSLINVWESISAVQNPDGQLSNHVLVFSDISAVVAVQEQLDFLAKHDPLTSLCNRRMLHDRLEYELAQALRRRKMVAVLLIDLDHFKTINDTLGHGNGDQLLMTIAVRLQGCVRASDTVARLGGDEFCIVLGDIAALGDVDQVARTILARLAEPVTLARMTCYVTGSIGIAMAPTDGMEVDALLRNADQAMYGAKHSGRNSYCFYAPFMQKAAETRLRISSGLHEALEREQFCLEYQPIVDLASGHVHKAEALLRWQHPEHGSISPAAFIPIAEECGLIGRISDWVLGQVLSDLARWRHELLPQLQISINVSAVHFRDPRNHERWLAQIAAAGLGAGALVLEITEGLLLDADSDVQQALQRYHAQGLAIALDDFGTGYSALSYLKNYELDYLKIDQSFLRQIAQNNKDHALCEAIVVMAHKLGLQVVAEGVETPEQAAILQAVACEYVQGFLYSRPLSPARFAALLHEQAQQAADAGR
ncbi:two-component system response regulator [Chitinilyticum litopenaei]|uniref:two-component system response regulator n=1 Tax=Chitinilyticum litopenaei TaxID=1121276 RepID=UPI0003F82443|nr:EAL domain-containing protein [Chitinilyticum litopenaei]